MTLLYVVELDEDEGRDLGDVSSVRQLVTCAECRNGRPAADGRLRGMVWCTALCAYRKAGWWCATGAARDS